MTQDISTLRYLYAEGNVFLYPCSELHLIKMVDLVGIFLCYFQNIVFLNLFVLHIIQEYEISLGFSLYLKTNESRKVYVLC